MVNRQNILLIMTDQHRFDYMGTYPGSVVETPYLDSLAAQGATFDNAYSAVPSCIPARATLMTGMDQWHTGILGMGEGMGEIPTNYAHTLPGELAKAGFHTQGVGKMHFYPQRALNGFHNTVIDESGRTPDGVVQSDYRDWFEQNKTGGCGYRDHSLDWNSWMARPSHLPEWLHPTHWTADQAIDFLRRRDPQKPFFLKMSFARPHSPYDPPQCYYDMYKNKKMPAPATASWNTVYPNDAGRDDIDAWHTVRSEEETQRARRCYAANISFIDHQVGRVLYEMQHTYRVLDDTLILFTSDHGDMLGDHGLWRKTYAYEGSSHIPLIVSPPKSWGGPRGVRYDQITELRDIMPTLLDFAGVTVPATCDGRSLLPIMRGENVPWRAYIQGEHCSCYADEQENYYVTEGKRKLIWLSRMDELQFFNLAKDPGEQENLADAPAYKQETALWLGRLVDELAQRDCGLVAQGRLVCQSGRKNLQSPHYAQYGCVTRGGDTT